MKKSRKNEKKFFSGNSISVFKVVTPGLCLRIISLGILDEVCFFSMLWQLSNTHLEY